ncbi:unnamed protein product [Alopecurus aequalis]
MERLRKEALLVDALSRHRDILRRETSFLTRESSQQISSDSRENKDFSLPISSEKVSMLKRMSRALVRISEHILKADEKKKNAISRKEEGSSVKEEDISSYKEHCIGWNSAWGSRTPNHGFFNDITTLSPMQFTSSTPGKFLYSATTGPALQIYSISIDDLHPNLDWPLNVWGVVAARDVVDRNRNILFCCSWADRQKLTQEEPFLCLTGPSRAIVAVEDVTFEVELQIKYGEEYQHTAVLAGCYRYHSACDDNPEIGRGCCTAKLSLEQLPTAIQATIVGLKVEEGWSLLGNGFQVFCSFSAVDVTRAKQIMLLDCGAMPKGPDRYISLSRNVVTVGSKGTLRVVIACLSDGNGCGIQGHVDFPVKDCQTSERELLVGSCKVKIVVAWSLIATTKENLVLEGYVPV